MRISAIVGIAALLTSCAAGPHPIPESVKAHVASAKALPEDQQAVGCSPASPCIFQSGVCYPPELAAHMASSEICCVDCLKELQKVDRPGVDTVTVIFSVLIGALAAGLTVVAGYELKDAIKK